MPDTTTDGPRPVPMTRNQLARLLEDMVNRVITGDSAEGHLTYTIPTDPAADFDVRAGYRIGNSMGQGGFRLIEQQPNALDKPGEETP